MDIGGTPYTNFRAVRLRDSANIRLVGSGGEGTVTVNHLEADRAWSFPDKSGRFPIAGTFAVQMQSVAAGTNIFSTIVTVSGIRTEDGLVVFPNSGVSAGYGFSASTAAVLVAAAPGAGNITMTFYNPGVSTGYVERIFSYCAVR